MEWDELFNLYFLLGWIPFLAVSAALYLQVRKKNTKIAILPLILIVIGLAWFLDALVLYIIKY